MEYEVLKKCALFDGIEPQCMASLLRCLRAAPRRYKKDAFILEAGQRAQAVGIVLAGGAYIIQEDFWGNRSILAHIEPGGMFGEALCCAQIESIPISAIAAEAAEILFIDYRKVVTVCPAACDFHSRIIVNMLTTLSRKNIQLTRKMEHLSKRSIREKLLSYLSAQAAGQKDGAAVVPFNRQQLADYLCVDRSALSRQLAIMQQEGLLRFEKNRFYLLK